MWAYNHAYHSTIKAKPVAVWEGKAVNKQKVVIIIPKIHVGDMVRVANKKGVFTKGDALTFSSTVHRVLERVGHRFVVEGDDTPRAEYELQKVRGVETNPQLKRGVGDVAQQAAEHVATQARRKQVREIRKSGLDEAIIDAAPSVEKRVRKQKVIVDLGAPAEEGESAPRASKPAAKKAAAHVPELFEIERLSDRKKEKGRVVFRVKWKGYPESESTWEPRAKLMQEVPHLVSTYERGV